MRQGWGGFLFILLAFFFLLLPQLPLWDSTAPSGVMAQTVQTQVSNSVPHPEFLAAILYGAMCIIGVVLWKMITAWFKQDLNWKKSIDDKLSQSVRRIDRVETVCNLQHNRDFPPLNEEKE